MLSMVRKFYTPQISYLCGKGGQQLFSIAIMSSSGFSTSRIADVNMGFESVKIRKRCASLIHGPFIDGHNGSSFGKVILYVTFEKNSFVQCIVLKS